MVDDPKQLLWFRNQLLTAGLLTLAISVIIFIGFILLFPSERGWQAFVSFGTGLFAGGILGTRRMPDPLKVAPLFNRQRIQFNNDFAYSSIAKTWKDIPKYLYMITSLFLLLIFWLITMFSFQSVEGTHFSIVLLFGGIMLGYDPEKLDMQVLWD